MITRGTILKVAIGVAGTLGVLSLGFLAVVFLLLTSSGVHFG